MTGVIYLIVMGDSLSKVLLIIIAVLAVAFVLCIALNHGILFSQDVNGAEVIILGIILVVFFVLIIGLIIISQQLIEARNKLEAALEKQKARPGANIVNKPQKAAAEPVADSNKVHDALQKKVRELEKFQNLMIGRELKMFSLKKEIKLLKKQLQEKQ